MKLGPTEQARLLVFQVAELARRNRDFGLHLNAPEAIAIACDAMHLAARAGGTFDEVVAAGMASVAPNELLDGVAALIGEIRVEVLLRDGSRLIVLRGLGAPAAAGRAQGALTFEPAAGRAPGAMIFQPGATVVADGAVTLNESLNSFALDVVNDSDHPIRVSSHFPFHRVNHRLKFDREAARGARLDIPAGDTVRWTPGERKTVRLVRAHPSEAEA